MRIHLFQVIVILILVAGCARSTPEKNSSATRSKKTEQTKTKSAENGKDVAKKTATKESNKPEVDGSQFSLPKSSFDTSYLAAEFCAALIIDAEKIVENEAVPVDLLNTSLTYLDISETGWSRSATSNRSLCSLTQQQVAT